MIKCSRCKYQKEPDEYSLKPDGATYKFCNSCRNNMKSYRVTKKTKKVAPITPAPESSVEQEVESLVSELETIIEQAQEQPEPAPITPAPAPTPALAPTTALNENKQIVVPEQKISSAKNRKKGFTGMPPLAGLENKKIKPNRRGIKVRPREDNDDVLTDGILYHGAAFFLGYTFGRNSK